MGGRRIRLGRALASVVIVGCAAVLALPAAASAVTSSDSVELTAPNEIESVTAHCPSGLRATGGGFRAPAPTSSTSGYSQVKIFASHKVGQRSWKVSGQEVAFQPVTLALTGYVYCSEHVPRTEAASKSVPVPIGVHGFTASKATCDAGKAQAGGFALSTPAYDGDLIGTQRRGKHSWRTRIDGDIGVTITSFAYCARGPLPQARGGTDSEIDRDYGTATSDPCPRYSHPLAGGFEQPDAITGFAGNDYRNFVPFASKRSGRGWSSSGQHGGPTSSSLVTTAYCG
jgi:hypothetical protein